jgi:hypothetical protein
VLAFARQSRFQVFGLLLGGRDAASDRAPSTRRGTGYSYYSASGVLARNTGTPAALPTDAKPVRSWADVDEALYNVTDGIRNVVEHINVKLAARAGEEQLAQISVPSTKRPVPIPAAIERTTRDVDEPKPDP